MSDIEEMLAWQLALQRKSYGKDPTALDPEERAEWIRWNVLALEDELHEALGEVGWKPWATSRHLNREQFKNELVDAWHFFMNLMLAAEIDGEEFFAAYRAKAAKNAERMATGYDGVTGKCPGCNRDMTELPPGHAQFKIVRNRKLAIECMILPPDHQLSGRVVTT
jgi:hypothetical protein